MKESEYKTPLQNVMDEYKKNLRRKLINVGTNPVVSSILAGRPKLAADYLGVQLNKRKINLTEEAKRNVDAAPIPKAVTDLMAVVDEIETMRNAEVPYSGNVEALQHILQIHRYKESKVITEERDFMLYEALLVLDFQETEFDFSALLLDMNWQKMKVEEEKKVALAAANPNYDVVDLLNLSIQAQNLGIRYFVEEYRAQMLNSE